MHGGVVSECAARLHRLIPSGASDGIRLHLTGCAAIATLTWSLGILMGMTLYAPAVPSAATAELPGNPTPWGIFSTNMRVLTGCFLGLVTCSIACLATLLSNGIYIGIQWKGLTADASVWRVGALLIPHGLLEVPGILLAGAAGLTGGSLARAFCRSGIAGVRRLARPILYAVSISTALISIAACIEYWNLSRI